jgi:SAM-dependent methyltransferase
MNTPSPRRTYIFLSSHLKAAHRIMMVSLSYSICRRRQYTSQFYNRWGFYKRPGRGQEEANRTADEVVVAETLTKKPNSATGTCLFSRNTDEATQPEESEALVAAPDSCDMHPALLRSSEPKVSEGVPLVMLEHDANLCHDPPKVVHQDPRIRPKTPPIEKVVEHLPALSQTLLSSPGSSLSGLASMRLLKERIAQNGRQYHSYGSTEYWGPEDEAARDVQDWTHHLWLICLSGRLYFAPTEHPKAVLDLGTGTGIWAVDVADQNPEASVQGTDLSAMQPDWVPPNLRFEIDDFNDNLWDSLKALKYDLIHARELLGTVPDWMTMYRKVYGALKPGGWFDQAEPSILFCSESSEFEGDHPFARWNKVMIDAGKKAGMEFKIGAKIKERLAAVGFVNVQVRYAKWPIGNWARDKHLKELGRFNLFRLREGIHGLCARRLMDQMGVRMFL